MQVNGWCASISWIPSESVSGWLKAGFDLRVSYYDEPPVDHLESVDQLVRMRADGRFRWANVLSGWADFTGEQARGGYGPESQLLMGSTTVRLGVGAVTFLGYELPVIRPAPETHADRVVLRQTVGGRTGVPLPRPVKHPPFARWQAPIVWTTLELTLHRDGRTEVALTGASAFPRHWVYGTDGRLLLKSGVTRLQDWMDHAFGPRTPWGEQDSPALVVEAESALERRLSSGIMRARPEVESVPAGTVLIRQGDQDSDVYLVLDGVFDVTVDGERVSQVGPGAVIGERASVEGGRRTATVTATTDARLARVPADTLDPAQREDLAGRHRREDSPP